MMNSSTGTARSLGSLSAELLSSAIGFISNLATSLQAQSTFAFSRFEDWPKLLFTQIPVSRAAMQHGAVQAKFLDAPCQLLRRTFRRKSWQSRKRLEPLRHI